MGSALFVPGHAARGGVDDHVEALLGEQFVLEGFGFGLTSERDGVLVRAVNDEDFGALFDAGRRQLRARHRLRRGRRRVRL